MTAPLLRRLSRRLRATLTALPLSGRLVIRPPKANDEQPNGKAGR